jgi:hypothetical protein
MATTVSLTGVVFDPAPATSLSVQFSDGTGYQFNDMNHLRSIITGLDSDPDFTRKLCLAYLLARSPDLSNVASVKNKSFIFDLSSPSPIKVQ